MPDSANPPELHRPFMADRTDWRDQLVDDVTQICQRVQYVEVAPARMWTPGLISEIADAADRLSTKAAKLQEAQGADR